MRSTFRHDEEGQMLIWVALVAGVLILFTAMAVDMGNIYYHKARLSNAVDAAVLTGVKLYGQTLPNGTTITEDQAQIYADDVFLANYGDSSPTRNYIWCPRDVASCPPNTHTLSLQLQSQAPVNTSFMAYLPQYARWTLGDTGQATRSTLVMTLVIDRSGSMCGGTVKCWEGQPGDNGGEALQVAVPNFVNDFLQGTDYLSLVSFASDARVEVAMTPEFKTPIDNAIAAMNFDGATFGTGAGTNSYNTSYGPPMSLADNQNTNGVGLVGSGNPITKVVIYFTDGLMNTIQDTLICQNTPPGPTLYNFGGYDASSGNVFDFINPTVYAIYPTGDYSASYAGSSAGGNNSGQGCNQGGNGLCNANPPYSATYSCKGVTTFPSQRTGGSLPFSRANITAEAQYRAITTANTMRQEAPFATYFYVIGLGSAVSGDLPTKTFLSTLANDPSGPTNYGCTKGAYPPATNCYNPNLPEGLFVVVPDCPSSACTNELNQAFQQIATKIRLRLSK